VTTLVSGGHIGEAGERDAQRRVENGVVGERKSCSISGFDDGLQTSSGRKGGEMSSCAERGVKRRDGRTECNIRSLCDLRLV